MGLSTLDALYFYNHRKVLLCIAWSPFSVFVLATFDLSSCHCICVKTISYSYLVYLFFLFANRSGPLNCIILCLVFLFFPLCQQVRASENCIILCFVYLFFPLCQQVRASENCIILCMVYLFFPLCQQVRATQLFC